MEAKDKKKIAMVFLLILLIAIGIDINTVDIGADGILLRGAVGEEVKDVKLILSMDGYKESYPYEIELEAVRATKEQAQSYFEQAKIEIDEDFEEIGNKVPFQNTYQDGIVQAVWEFDPIKIIRTDGAIVWEEIPQGGVFINASVTLTCGEYEQIYQFSFLLEQKEQSTEEKILKAIDSWLETEMRKEGESEIQLPREIEGTMLRWSAEQDYVTGKVVLLEVLAVFVIWFLHKKQKEDEIDRLKQNMEQDYPDVVEQMMLLLGAGMTIRQAWNRIATRYLDKRQKKQVCEKPAFERIVRLNRRLLEGENEKKAYQQFADETGLKSYHRFVRLLLGNLEKGAVGSCDFLEQESRYAYEQRVYQAKKLGEEASTRMLLPLMIMMVLVMAIVTLPAIVGFSI